MVRIMKASMVAISILMLVVLILSFQPYQAVHAQTAVPLESKALAYVTNVLPFDMSHYTITVGTAYSLPSAPNDPTITQAVDIDLKSSDSTIHVVCVYVNGALHQCGVSPTGTPPVSDRTYANVEDVVARILQAHQKQTGLDSTGLLNTLNLVNDTQTTKVTSGDVSLSVSQFPDIIGLQTVNGMPVPVASNSSFSVTFDWAFIQNGVPCCQVALTFDKDIFYNLQDERAIQPVGNTGNSIRGEQAATPASTPIVAAQQQNSTSPAKAPQPLNGTSPQTNQLPSKPLQKTADSQNYLAIPLLTSALATYIIMLIVVLTYKTKIKQKN
jgi:hypothetical protein